MLKNTINLLGPRADACKLRGYICAKLDVPKYDLAVLDFDFLVQDDPSDLNMLLHRACAQVGLQNWDGLYYYNITLLHTMLSNSIFNINHHFLFRIIKSIKIKASYRILQQY